jgi:hypothetical protein
MSTVTVAWAIHLPASPLPTSIGHPAMASPAAANWKKSGQCNIVIGGAGEAEVNVNWTPDEAFQNLSKVAEACGYFVTRGRQWEFFCHELEIATPEGYFRLTWWRNQFRSIDKIVTRTVWHRDL